MGAGNETADAEFTAFVAGATPELSRIAWYLTGDAERAKELVQASLVKTYLAWSRVRDGEAVAYTRRVMVNHRTDQWRRRRFEVLSADPTAYGGVDMDDPIHRSDLVGSLVQRLRMLPVQQRRVVILRYYCDLSERDVAQRAGGQRGGCEECRCQGFDLVAQAHV